MTRAVVFVSILGALLLLPTRVPALSIVHSLSDLARQSEFVGRVQIRTARVVEAGDGPSAIRCSIAYTARVVEAFKGALAEVEFHYPEPLLPGGDYLLNLRLPEKMHPNEKSSPAFSEPCAARLPRSAAGPLVFNISSPVDLAVYAEEADGDCGAEPHLQDFTFSVGRFEPRGPLGCDASIHYEFVPWDAYRAHLLRVLNSAAE